MRAADLLARAEMAGVTLQAAGTRLLLASNTPPPMALLHELAGAKPELLELLQARAEQASESAAILAEPLLPTPGTPERAKLDLAHAAMVAGLLAAAAVRAPRR
jgi:hypothetical protein